jgi:hypothetical protein
LRNKEAKNAITSQASKIMKGHGGGASAIKGASIAKVRAQLLHIPIADATSYVGIIMTVPTDTATIAILAPNRVINRKILM